MTSGSLAGFPVVDVRATLYDGSYHDVDSSVLAFQIAARGAFRSVLRSAPRCPVCGLQAAACNRAQRRPVSAASRGFPRRRQPSLANPSF